MSFRSSCLLYVLLLGLWGLSAPAQAQAQPDLTILEVDDSAYPQIEVYVSVADQARDTPLYDLGLENFFAATDQGETLPIASLSRAARPLRLSAVLDLTGSVSDDELDNQIVAIETLVEALSPADRLGIIVMDNDTVQVIAPLDEDPARIPGILRRLNIRRGVSGNVYWDGVGAALAQLENAPPVFRRAALIMTDVSPEGASGDTTEADLVQRAVDANISIYGLYFENEGDGVPPDPPRLPPELTALSAPTGGRSLGVAADQVGQNYTDDEALPVMMRAMIPFLQNEYRLTLDAPLPPDGQTRGLSLTLTYNGTPLPPERASFVAGVPDLSLDFVGVSDGDTLTLPYDLALDIQSNDGAVTRLRVVAFDETGGEIPLGEPSPDDPTLRLEAGMLPIGDVRLRAEAENETGNSASVEARVQVVEALTVRLIDPPAMAPQGGALTIRARVGAAERVQVASLLVDGAEYDVQLQAPFDDLRFEWTPNASGPVTVAVRVQDDTGATAIAETQIDITLGNDALEVEEEGGERPPVWVFALLVGVGGLVVIALGGGLLLWRRHKQSPRVYGAPSFQGDAPQEASPPPAMLDDGLDESDTSAPAETYPLMAPDPTPIKAPQATSARTPSGYLLVSEDDERWPLYKGENTIGRHGDNLVQIMDDSVSRFHATVIVSEKGVYYTDWQASHPSEINGELLVSDTQYTLRAGDRLRVGSTLLRLMKTEQVGE